MANEAYNEVVMRAAAKIIAGGGGTAGDPTVVSQATASALNATVVGEIADDAADTGTQVVAIGGKVGVASPVYTAGDRAKWRFGTQGSGFVNIRDDTSGLSVGAVVPSGDGQSASANGALVVASRQQVLNAAGTFDRVRSVATAPTGTAAGDMPLWTTSDLTAARINNAGASGDTAIVAAVASQTTRVHRLKISVAGATIVQIKDGATVLDVFNFAGNGGAVVLDFASRPWYKTTANTALNLNSSAAVQVDGRVEYITSA